MQTDVTRTGFKQMIPDNSIQSGVFLTAENFIEIQGNFVSDGEANNNLKKIDIGIITSKRYMLHLDLCNI
jgi:hypothetical protein